MEHQKKIQVERSDSPPAPDTSERTDKQAQRAHQMARITQIRARRRAEHDGREAA